MKKIFTLQAVLSTVMLIALSSFSTRVSGQTSLNMTLLANWDNNALPTSSGQTYSDVWGYARNGREYAIIGTIEGFYIFDITIPTSPVQVTFQQGSSTSSRWRDFKTYRHYLYVVSDQGPGSLQIYDLRTLPTGITKVYDSNVFFSRAHNIFIDSTSSGPTRLYAVGTDTQSNGVIMLDIETNPTNPTVLASFVLGGYVHDCFVQRDTMYAFFGNNGFGSFDFANLATPSSLDFEFSYPEQGYAHSGWATPDFKFMYTCDETHDTGVHMVDLSDHLNINVTGTFRSQLMAPTHTNSVPHNVFIRGNYLYIAYYHDGVQVWDITNRTAPVRIAYYDTYTGHSDYANNVGNWGVYPWLPSGTLIASDTDFGLFVLAPNFSLPIELEEFSAVSRDDFVAIEWATLTETNNDFFTLERSADGETFEEIAFVMGAGSSHSRIDYQYNDEAPLEGLSWYRLKQTDADGASSYSNTVSVNRGTTFRLLSVFPSPANQLQDVQLRMIVDEESDVRVTVTNLLGQQVHEQRHTLSNGLHDLSLPSTNWATGTYIARVSSAGRVLTKRFVVQ